MVEVMASTEIRVLRRNPNVGREQDAGGGPTNANMSIYDGNQCCMRRRMLQMLFLYDMIGCKKQTYPLKLKIATSKLKYGNW